MDGRARPGLSAEEAAERLCHDGPNSLPPPHRPSALRRLGAQLVHFFALLLWAAAVLAFVGRMPQLGIAIALVVVINAVFAFLQERRAERAAAPLRALLPQRVTVRRDGREQDVDAAQVVVGDVVVLAAGDRVPADGDLLEAHQLLVDASSFTGESEPAALADGPVFAGTFVVEGEAEVLVSATGAKTRLADIARLTIETPAPPSPLTRELQRVVRVVAAVALGVGSAFFLLTLAIGNPPSEGFMFAIGVTVALVPEALLPTVTLSLAWGAEQMAKRNVVVRKLDAVETLGSTTFICTDKTGTLTRNQMTVELAWTPSGRAEVHAPGYEPTADVEVVPPEALDAVRELALTAVRCSGGYVYEQDGRWLAHGDPMEAALDAFARRVGIDTEMDRRTTLVVRRFPFDARRRRMSIVVGADVLVKGAPDSVLPLCSDGRPAAEALVAMAGRGLRVLAVATRPTGATVPASADEAERGLRLLGLVAMEDPPRLDVAAALERCRRAGIKVAMITGDHPVTAATIAAQVGLRRSDAPVLVGTDLPDDDGVLGALLDRDGAVVARVSPEQKLRIARVLRGRGHVVAMTGDGVNDGPALHEADIGIAMGASGTDVAREAADLVLLDDHFASIVAGIELGRATFVNIRRFLTYHLTDNVAELTPFVVWALSGGRFPLAIGVLQVLALDIGTDTLSAVALGAEPPAAHLLDGPPVRGRLLNRMVARRAFLLLGPTEAAMSMAAFVVCFVTAGWRPGETFPSGHVAYAASGAAFMTVVLAQKANAFACRSATVWPGTLGWTTNRLLLAGATIELLFSLGVLSLSGIAHAMKHANPPLIGWAVALLSMAAVLGVDALDKRHRRRARRP